MITIPGRLAACWLLAVAAFAALSSRAWSGHAGPWDGIELWEWTVALTVAGAAAALAGIAGPARYRFTAATVGAVLTAVATAMWLREWWVIAHPSIHGWWDFFDSGDDQPVTARSASLARSVERPWPSGHLTATGHLAGGALLVALAASVVAAVRLARRPDQPAG